jgi:hypothetical protein
LFLLIIALTITVDTTGSEGDSLQKAIDSLQFLPGIDTVLVMEGTYDVTINGDTGLIMHDSLVLLANSICNCTLDVENSCGVIYCNFEDSSSHSAEINGFLINNGSPAIKLINSSPYIINCVIDSNYNGIYGEYSCPIIIATDIINNIGLYINHFNYGGGIYLLNSNVYIEDCKINENDAFGGDGGGGFFDSCNITMINNKIESNTGLSLMEALSIGGGLYITNSNVKLISNRISGNHALPETHGVSGPGGGIFATNSTIELSNNFISGNSTSNCGGGLYLESCSTIVNGDTIEGNFCGNGGGGIYTDNHIELLNCLISNNLALELNPGDQFPSRPGGGVYIDNCNNIKIENVEFRGNSGSSILGLNNSSGNINSAIFKDNSEGPMLSLSNSSIISISKCTFYNNINYDTSGFVIFNKEASCIKCSNSDLEIDKSLMFGNFAYNNSQESSTIRAINNSNIEIKNSLICDNGCKNDYGGTILTDASLNNINFTNSNIYYNTYQEDLEITNLSSNTLSADSNFWWVTDSASIDSLIIGAVDFIPFKNSFTEEAPGEPTEIDTVLNYSHNYATIVDSIGRDPDTLYLEITGHDRNNTLQEIAVAILKSSSYPSGIAVALLETDTATGIYRGNAIIKTETSTNNIRQDDIYQTIRVDSVGDIIKIHANTDTTKVFKVYYRDFAGIEENLPNPKNLPGRIIIEPVSNTLFSKPEFELFLPLQTNIQLSIYDISGRLADKFVGENLASGWHTISINNIKKSGVYFYKFSASSFEKNGKFVVIR